ncbi:hypothetical protein AURDEDRAFT_164156 [Auricularia subglabra TFB-10046 SS5]|nr:hypothetical protein AURDEDRAFT_164156 [Auricularia subglabra TFB-10046 SS5]
MSSPATDYPRASAALAGLGVTTQVALAATDGMPIVKQIVGVVARIVMLAEDIETRREALHALVENARSMGRRVEAIAAEHEMEGEMLSTLEALHRVLRSIESMLAEHNAKSRFRRVLSYAFTIKNNINRLDQELSRAVQEFLLVAALDTNGYVKDNSRYIGKFRLLRDFEVVKQALVTEQTDQRALYAVKYYSARVEGSGRVFAVRYLERSAHAESDTATIFDDYIQQRIQEHDQVLEQISTVQKAHPNVARFYGRSAGSIHNRFTVMDSGHYLAYDLAMRKGWGFNEVFSFALKVVVSTICDLESADVQTFTKDAARYLEGIGAAWIPGSAGHIFIDDKGTPTIGLKHDLRAFSPDATFPYVWGLVELWRLLLLSFPYEETQPPVQLGTEMFPDIPLDAAFNTCDSIWTIRQVIPRNLSSYAVRQETATYLQKMLACLGDRSVNSMATNLAASFFRPAITSVATGTVLYAEYWAYSGYDDYISSAQVDDTEEEIRYTEHRAWIPLCHKVEVRDKLRLLIPDPLPEDEDEICYSVSRTPGREGISNFVKHIRSAA